MATKKVVTVIEACAILQVSTSTIYRMFERDELTRLKVGGTVRIPMREVKALIGEAEAA